MEQLTREEKIEIIEDAITPKVVGCYYTADWGEKLGVYPDGSWNIGQGIGLEIAEYDQPLAVIECPGIANISATYFSGGWAIRDSETGLYYTDDGRELSKEEMIYEACVEGDVSDEIELIVRELITDMEWREYERESKEW